MMNFSNKLNSLFFNLINQVIQAVDPLLVLMNRIQQFPPVTGEKAKQLCALCSILYMEAGALPSEATDENLALIRQERDVLHRIAAGETAGHVLSEAELPMNASGTETLGNVWDLFETAVRLDSQEQRAAMFTLANELAECQNLLDWIEKTPEEKELPELVIGAALGKMLWSLAPFLKALSRGFKSCLYELLAEINLNLEALGFSYPRASEALKSLGF